MQAAAPGRLVGSELKELDVCHFLARCCIRQLKLVMCTRKVLTSHVATSEPSH